MNFITVTSDNYVPATELMLRSLRVWYPDMPVVVYALDTGWTDRHAAQLAPLNVTIRLIAEHGNTAFRGGAMGGSVHALFKLDALLEQTEPFLYLDADILVLAPLTEIFDAVQRDGWFTVHEGTTLAQSNAGEVAALTQFNGDHSKQTILNSGVLGCDPARFRDVFALALKWGRQISSNYQGDQGLINLAWFKLHGRIPPDHDTTYNGGWLSDDRIVLTQHIVHFARANYPAKGRRKVDDMRRVWDAWPTGVQLRRLRDEPFWRESLPHPWQWQNQCTARRHRDVVQQLRSASDRIADASWLVVDNPYEAHLLSPRLRRSLSEFWREHAHRFAGVPYVPTYHLAPDGKSWPALHKLRRQALMMSELCRARLRS